MGVLCRTAEPLMPPPAGPAPQRTTGDGEVSEGSFLRLGSLFRSDTGIREGLELRLRPVVFYSLSHHRLQHLFWKDIDCTCVVRSPRRPACLPLELKPAPTLPKTTLLTTDIVESSKSP